MASILASTFEYHFPFITKALRVISPKSFFAIKLKLKLHQTHLICHKFVRKMSVNSSNKALRTIPHPSIYNVRSYILHTGRCKGMTQEILRNFFILHHSLKYTIQYTRKQLSFVSFTPVQHKVAPTGKN